MLRNIMVVVLALTVVGLLLAAEKKPAAGGATGPAEATGPAMFRAGAYVQDATPVTWPVPVNGNMTVSHATGANDPISVRCLVLDDGRNRIAFAVVDSCMVYRETFDAAKALASKATGIPVDRMLMSATHTHSAPASVSVFQAEADPGYQQFLIRRIAAGIQKAHERLQPAQVGWAVSSDATQVFNRRWKLRAGKLNKNPFGEEKDRVRTNPGYSNADAQTNGPIDPEVSLLAVRTAKGKPLAVLANYSLHYVGGAGAGLSADYFAEFARQLQRKIGGDDSFVAMMSNGTSGDINNVNFSLKSAPKRLPMEQIRAVAHSVSDAAMKAYGSISFRDHADIAMAETEIDAGVRKPSAEEVSVAKQVVATGKRRPDGQLMDSASIYARETVLLADYPERAKMKLQAIRIGELGIAAIPCETFVEIGLAIKQKSPLKPTFTISLANGYNGYLPTAEQHELGGYETWRARSSYLEVGAAEKIEKTLLQLLSQVAK